MTRHVLVLLAALGLFAANPAQAGPLRMTFYDCGSASDCSGSTSVLASFDTPARVQAPAAPPAGTFSPVAAVDITRTLAGHWDELDIFSFNLSGFIGSDFRFSNLVGSDGHAYDPLIEIAPYSDAALHLQWGPGTYEGLGVFTCVVADCTRTMALQAYVQLVVEAVPVQGVPEPSSAALGLLALGLAGAAARRRTF